jgi:flagellar motor switch protein FliN/FliY
VTIRVGTTNLSIGRLTELKNEDILRLDRAVGEPFELLAHGISLGEVELVASDESIALKLLASGEDDDESSS